MDRNFIERRDFAPVRRGYDPAEVDEHLREVADTVAQLERSGSSSSAASVASAAADQVRAIVDVAERSAAEIQDRAEQEAQRLTSDAEQGARELREQTDREARESRERTERESRETREQADADAAAHVSRVEEATQGMLDKAGSAQAQIDQLLERLRTGSESLVGELRGAAESVQGDLQGIREELPSLRPSSTPGTAGSGSAGPAAATADADGEEVTEVRDAAASDVPETTQDELPAEETPDEFEGEEEALVQEPVPAPAAEDEEPVVEDEPLEAEPEPAADEPEPAAEEPAPPRAIAGSEGARLIALNMALNGTPRDETARYLADNFDLDDQDSVLDEVYSRVG